MDSTHKNSSSGENTSKLNSQDYTIRCENKSELSEVTAPVQSNEGVWPPTTGFNQCPTMVVVNHPDALVSDRQPIIHSNDEEAQSGDKSETFSFSDKTIRRGFIRKVYTILMCQLAVTTGFIALFVYHSGTQRFVQENPLFFLITFLTVFVVLIVISCCSEVRRKTPMNYIFLAVFTLAESLLLGCIAMKYDPDAVLMAAGVCAIVCLGLSIFAMQTKWDFTVLGGSLFAALLIVFVFSIVAICIPSKVTVLLYASMGALLFSVYLVYDTQIMIGGKHKYSISPEEYIFAALSLYMDVINIFLYILTIVGVSRK